MLECMESVSFPNLILQAIENGRNEMFYGIFLGHMASWRGSGILADCRDEKGNLVASSMLDPSKESTFAFLKEFLKDVLDTFKDQFIHLGGDETAYWTQQCW